jgi:hypothetical protein
VVAHIGILSVDFYPLAVSDQVRFAKELSEKVAELPVRCSPPEDDASR